MQVGQHLVIFHRRPLSLRRQYEPDASHPEGHEALGAMQAMAIKGFIVHNRESNAYALTDSGRATLTAILEDAGLCEMKLLVIFAASIMLSLATASPACAFSEPYHIHIGWPATLLCRQFSALKGDKRDVAIGWALGYTSGWQAARFEDIRGNGEIDAARLKLRLEMDDAAIKPEEVPAFVKRIEQKCRERPSIFFSDATNMAASTSEEDIAPASKHEQDMTCRGPLRTERIGYCHFEDGTPGIKMVLRACREYRPCVMRARVVPRGEPVEGFQNYNVLKVYSARRGR